MGTPLTFSVVVPVFDEEDTIGDCLTRLAAQFDQITEIVVVDNNSTDGGRAVIDAWCSADPRVRVIDEARQGLVYARNAGLDAATGDLIARIDADTVVVHGSERGNLKQALLKLGWPAEDYAGYVDGEAHPIDLDEADWSPRGYQREAAESFDRPCMLGHPIRVP